MAGHTPYWIGRDRATKRPYVDWHRAAHIMRAIRRYMRGDATNAILDDLRTHAPSPIDGRPIKWQRQTLMSIFSHPALFGVLYYAASERTRQRQPDGTYRDVINHHHNERTRNLNPKAIQLNVSPLMHRDGLDLAECRLKGGCPRDKRPTFAALEAQRATRRHMPSAPVEPTAYPLRRLLTCACRLALSVNRNLLESRTVVRLTCHTMRMVHRTPNTQPCRITTTIDAFKLWQTVRAQLIADIRTPGSIAPALPASAPPPLADNALSLEIIETKLADLDAADVRLYHRYDAQEITQAIYEAVSNEQQTRRAALSRQKQELLEAQLASRDAELRTQRLRELLAELAPQPLEDWTDEQWCEPIRDLVATVRVNHANQPTIDYRA